ncbi:hypothetical protein Bca4012_015180 [Brassica carinata]
MGEENDYYHVDKKTRLEEVEQQQQQQNQDPSEQDLQLQSWRRQQNQFLQSMSSSQRPNLSQQQRYIQHQDLRVTDPHLQALLHRYRQQQLRRHLQQQRVAQQIPPNVCPFGVCAQQKFMMFLYHIKQRPEDNSITFWRKLVAEYYSPRAKQRLCFSQYERPGHILGMFPLDMWHCSLCGTKSGKGVEATFDVLPRLFQIRYASGVINEFLSLEDHREYRASSGLMVVEYRKMVQTTEYEQCRVVHEGPLRIIFSQDLKILYWEFCTRRHEEFLVRRHIAPKVNQLLEAAQKCQSAISESGTEGVSQQDLQTNSNMVLEARRQLANSMEIQFLNDHGYPETYVRSLQIYEVVKSMKRLMDLTQNHKIGPIEGWKRLSEQTERMRLQRQKMQEMEQLGNSGAMNRWSSQAQMDGLTGNNNNNSYNHHHSSAQAAAALTNNNQIMPMRRLNAMNNPFWSQRPTPNSNQSPYWSDQRQNLATDRGFLSSPQMQQQQQRTMHGTPNTLQQTHLPEDATEIPDDDFSDNNFCNDSGK